MIFDPMQVFCLASAIYFESRGRPLVEQVLVGQVVMERVMDSRYPSDVCSVVWSGYGRGSCAFSWACDDNPNEVRESGPWTMAVSVAVSVLGGTHVEEGRGYTLFFSGDIPPWWARSDKTLCDLRVGAFTFCKERRH